VVGDVGSGSVLERAILATRRALTAYTPLIAETAAVDADA
jgi:hypothetical protein